MASRTDHVDATPRVEGPKTAAQIPLSPDTPALRLIHGRYTVDLLPVVVEDNSIAVIVSAGELGTSPTTASVPIGLTGLLVEAATVVRKRRVIDTAGWVSPAIELN